MVSKDSLIDILSSDIFYDAKHDMFSKCMLAKRVRLKIVINFFILNVTYYASKQFLLIG